MEVEIISKEIIIPSSPTPCHLRTFNLCLLDQLIPAPYAPLVLFYPNYDGIIMTHLEISEKLQVLKQSLSRTLSKFYPLAGVIKDDLSIECNDKGAYCATTKVNNLHLSDFLDEPNLDLITQFLPCDPSFQGSMAGKRVTNIQINLFECGGIAIGLCISHKVLDGSGLKTFLKSWAGNGMATTKRKTEEIIICPNLIAASSLFPANDLWLRDSSIGMWISTFKKGKSITRRFVFDSSSITRLRTMAKNGSKSDFRSPTRVESISAFLWKSVKSACESVHGSRRSSMLTHIVNLRKRAIPALSEHSVGNLIWISSAKCPANLEKGLPELVDQVRSSISKIDGDYIKKLCGNKGSSLMRKSLKEIGEFGSKEEGDYIGFSSWCGFGFYDIDFGWGKPIWVSSYAVNAPVFMNLVLLLETRNGDGIEAWVTLDEQEMEILKHNQEFLAFASLDPSPLKLGNVAVI
ncbi:hypothetical protein M9H77_20239 [Catharanthus roseus]|uniref:Uncharacterized protein n=1 Tax=Catharanthus roseus TaxID=4058 RepID=A0ACC0AN54_CATRO|nr:hypothetical protein M9H77_20239 [Catharanthus roseus]